MAVINVLDRATANLIAAGEVVERPCSVVKELLENAIDAGSTSVTVEIKNGGSTLIRVTDNGCGMQREDVELSIKRHATSKITAAADLDAIGTLGFRGEALAAISSVSRFTVLSKRAGDPLGTQMLYEGDVRLSLEEAGCPDGTTVIVRDLFFNQPARRKFLKRDRTEASAVAQYVERIALSHPEIGFKFISDGETKIQTAGNGNLFDAIYSVFGKEFSTSLTEISSDSEGMKVSGYITRPEFARANRSFQSFFINSRFVKSKTMFFALEDAFKSYLKSDRFPGCVIFLETDPHEVDVNVHPAKTEVRFSDEHAVYDIICSAVRNTLEGLNNPISNKAVPDKVSERVTKAAGVLNVAHESTQIKFAAAKPIADRPKPEYSVNLPSSGIARVASSTQGFPNKFERALYDIAPAEQKTAPLPRPAENPAKHTPEASTATAQAPAPLEKPELMPAGLTDETENKNNPIASDGIIRGVLFDAYICYEAGDTVYLIDKHAAHERILYERLKMNARIRDTQLLLEPVIIPLHSTDYDIIEAHLNEISDMGFILESFGENTFALRGVPAELQELNSTALTAIIEKTASELKSGGRASAADDLMDRMLFTAACKAAVKAGIPDDMHDYEWIVEGLKTIDNIVVCPHGRPIVTEIKKHQLEKMFLRS